jgi:hypothetical protein
MLPVSRWVVLPQKCVPLLRHGAETAKTDLRQCRNRYLVYWCSDKMCSERLAARWRGPAIAQNAQLQEGRGNGYIK